MSASVKLTVVGCSGSVSGPESPASSYLVQAPYQGRTFSLVLDLGPGAFGALYRYLDPQQVDAFALTHLHADHCLDLCAAYVAARYSPQAPTWPRQPVYGPPGTAARLTRAYEVPDRDGRISEPGPSIADHFEYHDWRPEQRIGPFRVRTAPVEHPVPAWAIRVEEVAPEATTERGGSLVYSGDTGPCEALVELARGADLLLVESAFLDRPGNPGGLHLTGAQAAAAGERAGVAAVILTHIPPWYDPEQVLGEAAPHTRCPVSLALPGASWAIGAA
ncbi:MAG: Ribonuclease tRNA processing enzyme [Friedmanniella sp.]|nr:Ribonuclease tRNA processing enzyme [Friedmanniella sp.]